MKNKLYKSNSDKVLGGVCGGIGEYFEVDSTIIRLVCLLTVILGAGAGLILYLLAWIIIPNDPEEEAEIAVVDREDMADAGEGSRVIIKGSSSDGSRNLGIILIIIGAVLLFRQFAPFHIPWMIVLPALFILGGFYLILSNKNK